MNNWTELLRTALTSAGDPVPDGWDSMVQIAKKMGIDQSTACRRMRKLMDLGLVDTQRFKVPGLNGTIQSIPHYRIKNGKPPRKS